MRHFWLILIIVVYSSTTFSQIDTLKSKINFVGINTGFGYYRYNDPTESANVYLGKYIPVQVAWSALSNKYNDRFSFTYSSIDLENTNNGNWSMTDFSAKYFQINYHYHRIISNKHAAKLFLGGGINSYFTWRTLVYEYYPGNIVDSNNGDLFFSANISLASTIRQKNNFLFLSINNSLFAYINPSILRTGQTKGRLMIFPRFNSFIINADYKIKMNKILYLDLAYSFFYYRYPRYDKISITKGAHNQLFAGINIKF